jgi:hypothetical protein
MKINELSPECLYKMTLDAREREAEENYNTLIAVAPEKMKERAASGYFCLVLNVDDLTKTQRIRARDYFRALGYKCKYESPYWNDFGYYPATICIDWEPKKPSFFSRLFSQRQGNLSLPDGAPGQLSLPASQPNKVTFQVRRTKHDNNLLEG